MAQKKIITIADFESRIKTKCEILIDKKCTKEKNENNKTYCEARKIRYDEQTY